MSPTIQLDGKRLFHPMPNPSSQPVNLHIGKVTVALDFLSPNCTPGTVPPSGKSDLSKRINRATELRRDLYGFFINDVFYYSISNGKDEESRKIIGFLERTTVDGRKAWVVYEAPWKNRKTYTICNNLMTFGPEANTEKLAEFNPAAFEQQCYDCYDKWSMLRETREKTSICICICSLDAQPVLTSSRPKWSFSASNVHDGSPPTLLTPRSPAIAKCSWRSYSWDSMATSRMAR